MSFAAIKIQTEHGLVVGLLALALFGLSWWMYFRQSKLVPAPYWFLLPTLRSLAIVCVVLLLTQPVVLFSRIDGTPSNLHILVDRSASMNLPDRINARLPNDDRIPRRVAVRELLLENSTSQTSLLTELCNRFNVTVSAFDSNSLVQLGELSIGDNFQSNLDGFRDRWFTEIENRPDDSLLNETDLFGAITSASHTDSVLLLLTDGNQNSVQDSIKQLDQIRSDLKIYGIGFGPNFVRNDFGLTEIETSQNWNPTIPITGSVHVAENFPSGTAYTITGFVDGRPVWSWKGESNSDLKRDIPFSIELPSDSPSDNRIRNSIKQIELEFEISSNRFEPYRLNNSRKLVINQTRWQRNALLIDAFPRWESRYLKNLLERHSDWEIDLVLTNGRSNAAPMIADLFSSRIDDHDDLRPRFLSEYNLIILGDVSRARIDIDLQQEILEAVNQNGVGLVTLGSRNGFVHGMTKEFDQLHPVTPKLHNPITTGELEIRSADFSGQKINQSITKIAESEGVASIQYVRRITPKPGSETIADLVDSESGTKHPWIVTQQFGAGRSTYIANDETWRLRARFEDELHAMLWLPILDFTARPFYAIDTDFLSLHVDEFCFSPNEAITSQLRLKPALLEKLAALNSGAIRLNVTSPAGRTRSFDLGQIKELELGGKDLSSYKTREYSQQIQFNETGIHQLSVAIDGIPFPFENHHLELSVDFDQQSEQHDLMCNLDLLKNITQQFNGTSVHASDAKSILSRIKQQSKSELVRQETILRASYWWFVPTIFLLAVEWVSRKRVGLT